MSVDAEEKQIATEMAIVEKLIPTKSERVELELAMAKKYITRAALLHGAMSDDIDPVSREMLAGMSALTRAQEKLRGQPTQREPGDEQT